ncbi:hypothetical protein, partial [Klebsiella pneumoniae]
QTETEATGAPQKHHYTLNQQVGSITRGERLIVLARNLNGNNILLLPLLPTNRFFADNEPQRDIEQSCR